MSGGRAWERSRGCRRSPCLPNWTRLVMIWLRGVTGHRPVRPGREGRETGMSQTANGTPVDPAMLQALRWRLVGPHRGGRVVAVAGHPTEVGTFYFGGVGGGVWKTTDAGVYWRNISDGFFNVGAIGALA